MLPPRKASRAIGTVLEERCEFAGGVFPTYNPQAPGASACVVPGDPWGEYSDESGFCEPDYNLEIVLVLPGATPPADALDWFEQRIAEITAALDDDPTCGGAVDGAAIRRWTRPGQVAGPNGDLYQVIVTLAPVSVQP